MTATEWAFNSKRLQIELEVQIQLGPAGDGEARDSGWDEPTGYCTDHGSYDPAGNCSGCEEEEDLH